MCAHLDDLLTVASEIGIPGIFSHDDALRLGSGSLRKHTAGHDGPSQGDAERSYDVKPK